MCSICNREEETVSHVLFTCSLAAQVWSDFNVPLPSQGFSNFVSQNLEYVFGLIGKTELEQRSRSAILWLLWEIWKARNSVLYAARTQDHHFVIATALEEAEEWIQHNQRTTQEIAWDTRNRSRVRNFWTKPAAGRLKCNIHSSWINEGSFCGGAWIIRNHMGDALFHARDAFLPFFNRIAAELKCILWTLQSLHDLHISSCEVWTDCSAAVLAVENPQEWPKYRSILSKILQVVRVMGEVSFHLSSPKANSLGREITCSFTRDGRLTSYLALGGPSWLQDRINKDRRSHG